MRGPVNNLFDRNGAVLIVDDCPIYRTAAQGMFQKVGFLPAQIITVADAKSAVEVARKEKLQLVLCDYNLGNKPDGHQLLEHFIERRLLPADCVTVIITGDASADVVRGFAELEPDGYLVKPVSFNDLKLRLPKIAYRKRKMSDMLNHFEKGEYQDVLVMAGEVATGNTSFINAIELLKAKSLIQLQEFDKASAVLTGLLSSKDRQQAQLILAGMHLVQQNHSAALAVSEVLVDDPVLSVSALELQANVFLQKANFEKALEKIEKANEKSSRSVERLLFQGAIALTLYNLDDAISCASKTTELVRNAFRDESIFYFHLQQLLLDKLQFNVHEDNQETKQQLARLKAEFSKRFASPEALSRSSLISIRENLINGMEEVASQEVKAYQAVRIQKGLTVSAFDYLELAKIHIMLGDGLAADKLIESIGYDNDLHYAHCLKHAARPYIEAWQRKLLKLKVTSRQFLEKGMKSWKAGQHNIAVSHFIDARKYNQSDAQTVEVLLSALTHAWPDGWNKREVSELVMRCKSALVSNQQALSEPAFRHLQKLAEQLSLPEVSPLI